MHLPVVPRDRPLYDREADTCAFGRIPNAQGLEYIEYFLVIGRIDTGAVVFYRNMITSVSRFGRDNDSQAFIAVVIFDRVPDKVLNNTMEHERVMVDRFHSSGQHNLIRIQTEI